jgi:hypothetical protein
MHAREVVLFLVGYLAGMVAFMFFFAARKPNVRIRYFVLDADNNALEITGEEFHALKPIGEFLMEDKQK